LIKDKSIQKVVKHLSDKFGAENFRIKDNWEMDLCAIGLTDKSEKYMLYILTYKKRVNHYFISLENSSSSSDHAYDSVGEFDDLDLNELERHFTSHLRINCA
jgi:hypothetical protein